MVYRKIMGKDGLYERLVEIRRIGANVVGVPLVEYQCAHLQALTRCDHEDRGRADLPGAGPGKFVIPGGGDVYCSAKAPHGFLWRFLGHRKRQPVGITHAVLAADALQLGCGHVGRRDAGDDTLQAVEF